MTRSGEATIDGSQSAERSVQMVQALVELNEPIAGDYYRLTLASRALPRVQPGQFFQVLCPAAPGGLPFLRRPMSVYRTTARRIEFLYRVTGVGTQGLATLAPGHRLSILGPLGIGFRLDPAWRHIVVVARGVGLATLAPLVDVAARTVPDVTVILSARSPKHLIAPERFRASGARVMTVFDSDGTSAPRYVERVLRELISVRGVEAFFTCGSNRLLALLQQIASEYGLTGQVAVEQQMACGLGMCFSCVRRVRTRSSADEYRRVCWDGPVFAFDEIEPC